MSTITRTLQAVAIALALTTAAGCQWPAGSAGTGSGSGTGTVGRVKYTCSNGTVETTDATCGNRATCEDLCQHSGGSGGSCSSSAYFCSVAQ
jgi:hypothetical protein